MTIKIKYVLLNSLFSLFTLQLNAQIGLVQTITDGDIINDLNVKLSNSRQIELTCDGKFAYILVEDGLSVFSINIDNGNLKFEEFLDDVIDFPGDIGVFEGAKAIAISPDDKNLYIVSNTFERLTMFSIAADGSLTYIGSIAEGQNDADGLESLYDIAVSPDGKSVFTITEGFSTFKTVRGAIAQFSRDTGSGLLTFDRVYKDSDFLGGLYGGNKIFISPDGLNVYATDTSLPIENDGFDANHLVFSRDLTTGDLTYIIQSSLQIEDLVFGSGSQVFFTDRLAIYRGVRDLSNNGTISEIESIRPFGFDYNSSHNITMDSDFKSLYVSRYFESAASVLLFDIQGDAPRFINSISNSGGWDIAVSKDHQVYQISYLDNKVSLFSQTLIVPQDIKIDEVTANSITFSWHFMPNATGYTVQLADNVTGDFQTIIEETTTQTSYTFSGLSPETSYQFRVRAFDEVSTGDFSSEIGEETLALPLELPILNEAFDITSKTFSLSWEAVEGADEYFVYVSDDDFMSTGIERLTSTVNTQIIVDGLDVSLPTSLAPNTLYKCRISAVKNGSNTEVTDFSNIIAVTTLPDSLILNAATNITSTSFSISWGADPNASSYAPLLSTDNFVTLVNPYNTSEMTTEATFTYTGLTPNTTYQAKVSANDENQTIWFSNEISVTALAQTETEVLSLDKMSDKFIKIWFDPNSNRLFFSQDRNVPIGNEWELLIYRLNGSMIMDMEIRIDNTIKEIDFTPPSKSIYLLRLVDSRGNNQYSGKFVVK